MAVCDNGILVYAIVMCWIYLSVIIAAGIRYMLRKGNEENSLTVGSPTGEEKP